MRWYGERLRGNQVSALRKAGDHSRIAWGSDYIENHGMPSYRLLL